MSEAPWDAVRKAASRESYEPEVVSEAPERIRIDSTGDDPCWYGNPENWEENDVEYVRADLYAALEQELRDANTANADAAARSVAVEVRETELARLREAVRESINAIAAKDYEEAYNRLYWAYYGPKGNAAAEQGEPNGHSEAD